MGHLHNTEIDRSNAFDRPELSSEDLFQPGAATALLAGLREEQEVIDDRKGKAARRAMINAYHIALVALEHDDLWAEICCDPAWEAFKQRPKLKDRRNALRYAIRLSVGFRGKSDNSIVSTRYRAMCPSFVRRETPARVKELLDMHGGAEGLYAWEKQPRPAITKGKRQDVPERTVRLYLTGADALKLASGQFSEFKIEIAVNRRDAKGIHAKARVVRPYLRLNGAE